MKPVLEIKNLTKTFVTEGKSDFTAVDHVSFQLYPGETLGIAGSFKYGKSRCRRPWRL
jgi:ABC-type glutathione transport system ATPase component